MEFLVNGRIMNQFDEFTSKGSLTVGYIIIPHELLQQCCTCKVTPMTSLAESHGLTSPLGKYCKLLIIH